MEIMGVFVGIIITLLIIYFFNRFDISRKKFWIIFSLIYFVITSCIALEIHNVQPTVENEFIIRVENVLNNMEQLMLHKVIVLKIINVVVNYFIIVFMYRIINKATNKKCAQIFVVLYSILANVLLNILVLSMQPLFLLFTLVGMDVLYESEKIKNSFARIIISTLCLSIANLIIPNAIPIIAILVIYEIINIIKKEDTVFKGLLKIFICVIIYVVILLLANLIIGDSSIYLKEITLGTKYNNSDILSYLSETGINISDYTIGLYDFLEFIDLYDVMIIGIVFFFFVIGVSSNRGDMENVCLTYLLWAILVWLIGEDNKLCVYLLRPYIFILASVGLKKFLNILKMERILCLDKIKGLETRMLVTLNKLKDKKIVHLLVLGVCSYLLTRISLYYSTGSWGRPMYESYLKNKWIMFYNWLPIFYTMFLMYNLTRKVWASNLFGAVITFIITFVNYFKMQFRNDTFLMEDITLIKEAMNMQQNYTIKFSPIMIACFVGSIILSIFLYVIIDRKNKQVRVNFLKRGIFTIILILFAYIMLDKIYLNNSIYAKTTNNEVGFNVWSSVNQYISRGTIYSFLNSYSGIRKYIPDGYDKKKSQNEMDLYEYSNIPDDKKVNIIGIMLEAYNDFSKFEKIEFEVNPYEKLYEIEEESYSGELVTSIFAGGTVDTERKFLTGYTELPTFRKNTNSYVNYFKEQGYIVEGSHPCYEWFYNRVNVNRNIGFDNYYFFENKYGNLSGGTLARDEILMPEILNLYNLSKSKNKPYFSFNVTYQNHGPYSTEANSKINYVKNKDFYTVEEYNIMNNYFEGIADTTENLYNMINELKNDNEPVILVFFGDHNPWLGNDNSVYNMLGINFELNQEEGAYNYYCTPYVIWANDKAKQVLNNDFIGDGEKISPNFLMNTLFELAGYEGNEFMKLSNEVKLEIGVINPDFYVCNNKFTTKLDEDKEEILRRFEKLQYYWIYDKK
ncbi:MAG: LTA synthase family protein [Clostridia bacterium]